MLELATSNWLVRSLFLVGIFALVALIAYGAIAFSSRRARVTRELASLTGPVGGQTKESLTRERKEGVWAQMVQRIEERGLNLGDTNDTELRELMKSAGFKSPTAPRVYTLVRLLLVFLLPGVYLMWAFFQAEPPATFFIYFMCIFLAVLALYLPNIFVRYLAHRRRREIINGFPDSLDLMLVCVEAGLGLESTLDRVGREMVTSHPLISNLITETTLLMRAGASREDALRKLGENSGVDEIRSFATLLIQSDRLGTSLATTLRVYSAEMREARRLRAEEKAHRLPVLLSIPLVVFMLPSMIGVLTLPAIVLAIREVIPSM